MRLACGVVVLAALAGCGSKKSDDPAAHGGATPAQRDQPSVTLHFAYSSEKKAWLDQMLPAFAATHPKTPSGKAIVIDAKSFGSGEASAAILDGSFKANVYSPASAAYLALLDDQWRSSHGGKRIAPTSEPLVLSPIVIANSSVICAASRRSSARSTSDFARRIRASRSSRTMRRIRSSGSRRMASPSTCRPPPDGVVVRNLMMMWTRLVQP